MPASTLALVTARGGSKGIPRKNVKPLAGRPLIAWGLRAIQASGVVERTCVTTDDVEIAAIARAAGADVPFLRPAELATDSAPSIDVIEHALLWLDEHETYRPEYVLLVQPTEPFIRPDQIRDSFELMLERRADAAITAIEVPRRFHPFHVREQDAEGWIEFRDPDAHYAHTRRQDDPVYWSVANLYWFRREAFLETRKLETGRRVALPVDTISAHDLDTLEDWAVAEALVATGHVVFPG